MAKEIKVKEQQPSFFSYRSRLELLSFVFLSILLGIQCGGLSDKQVQLKPFSQVMAGYEQRVSMAQDQLARDSSNVKILEEYVTRVLEKIRFDREVGSDYRKLWRAGEILTGVATKLEQLGSRDSTSITLKLLLSKTYIELFQSVPSWQSPDEHKLDRAIRSLRKVIELDSALFDSRLELALMLSRKRESHEVARKMMSEIVNTRPHDGKAWYYLGLGYSWWRWSPSSNEDDYDQARRCFVKAEKYGLERPLSYVNMAELRTWGSLLHNDAYVQAVSNIPGAAKGFFFLGANLFLSDGSAKSIELYRKAIELNPYCFEALSSLASLSYETGKTEDAIRYYLRGDEIDSTFSFWQWSHETNFYDAVIQQNPKNYRAHVNLGQHYLWKDDTARAIEFFEKAAAMRPDVPYAFEGLGEAYLLSGEYEKAENAIQRGLALGMDANGVFSLANKYRERGFQERAFRLYEKVLKIPFSRLYQVYSVLQIAEIFREQGLTQKAHATYKMTIDSLRTNVPAYLTPAEAHRVIGDAFVALKKYGDAVGWYSKALKERPEDSYYISVQIADAYVLQKRYDKSIQILEQLLKESVGEEERAVNQRATINTKLGESFLQKKDWTKALEAFEKAVALASGLQKATALTGLAKVYAEMGLRDKAIEVFENAERLGSVEAKGKLQKLRGK